jgi:hypothetical protein
MSDKRKKKKHAHADILRDAIETLELTIRSARRCAYDLNHAAGDVRDASMRKIYQERADFFVKLFQSGNAMKDYRHRLYDQISDLEFKLKQLRDLLAEHKIDDPTCF